LQMSGFIAIRLCIAVVWVVAKPSDLAAARHTRIDAIFHAVLTANFMHKQLLSQSYPSAAAQSHSRLVSSQGRPAAPVPVSVLREFRYARLLNKDDRNPSAIPKRCKFLHLTLRRDPFQVGFHSL
jgi:hypothetical protein